MVLDLGKTTLGCTDAQAVKGAQGHILLIGHSPGDMPELAAGETD
jgi:hypothetical protein